MVLAPVTTMWTAEAMAIIPPSTFTFLLVSFVKGGWWCLTSQFSSQLLRRLMRSHIWNRCGWLQSIRSSWITETKLMTSGALCLLSLRRVWEQLSTKNICNVLHGSLVVLQRSKKEKKWWAGKNGCRMICLWCIWSQIHPSLSSDCCV